MKGTTKGTKVKPAASDREECGIWLDTTELKEKKQQRQRARPISKLLNPLARSDGYSVAVALNFTQTKLNLPVTRQSTISSFFSPKTTDSIKNTTSDEYTPLHTEACSGTKRKLGSTLGTSDITSQTSEVCQKNCDVEHEDVSVRDVNNKKEKSFFHLICGNEPEEGEPPGKRRAFEDSMDLNVLETQEYLNKEASARSRSLDEIQTVSETETLFYESQGLKETSWDVSRVVLRKPHLKDLQGFKDKHVLIDQKTSTREAHILTTRPINAIHKKQVLANTNVDQEQSWYKSKASPVKLTGKENRQPASSFYNAPSSPNKQRLASSPAKSRLKKKNTHSFKKSGSGESGTQMAGDSHAILFTQDSEGFCVIAHRDRLLRSPPKDKSNVSGEKDYRNSPPVTSLDKEDEESDLDAEMLFTQDSEGNVVIKH